MQTTNIEWCDFTWNPIRGCSRISPGCMNCYAELDMARKNSNPKVPGCHGYAEFRIIGDRREPHWTGNVELIESKLLEPLSWRKKALRFAQEHGRKPRVFVNSMSDLFHTAIPDMAIDSVFAVMALCPEINFLLLTKRSGRMTEYFSGHQHGRVADIAQTISTEKPESFPFPIANVWLGVSVEDQKRADERIPHLLRTPAAVRFLSVEPMLEEIDLSRWLVYNTIHGTNATRRETVLCDTRSISDRRHGENLENSETPGGPMEGDSPHHSHTRTEGGKSNMLGIPTGISARGRSGSYGAGSPLSVVSSLRSHTKGVADQPQEWEQVRQPSRQSGVSNSIQKSEPFIQDRITGSIRGEESSSDFDRSNSGGDSIEICNRQHYTGSTSEEARSIYSTDFEDCTRGASGTPRWSDSRLLQEKKSGPPDSQPTGAISMIIVGGESGAHARPFDLAWARSLRDQCKAAGVAFYMKQVGSKPEETVIVQRDGHKWQRAVPLKDRKGGDPAEWPEDLRVHEVPECR